MKVARNEGTYDIAYAKRAMLVVVILPLLVMYTEAMLTPALPTIQKEFGVNPSKTVALRRIDPYKPSIVLPSKFHLKFRFQNSPFLFLYRLVSHSPLMSITVLTLPTGKIGFSVYFLSNVQALCRELTSLWITS
ncbi:hypothetical protein [Thermococcus sp. PK]|uniref:hypothetical protein n=1 Tax=Thermococcus sp. PK TaxID=913025 RepID=UPI0005B2E4FA|nr:hypothetical protein [Thermococcus sp. PK]